MEIKKFKLKLSETLLIFSIPVFFYALLYCLEVGYADYFDIPFGLVTVGFTDYVPYSIIILLALIITLSFVYLSAFSYDALYSDKRITKKYIRILFASIFRAIPFAIILGIQDTNFNSASTIIIYAIIYSVLVIIMITVDINFINPEKEGYSTLYHSIFKPDNRNTYFIGTLIFQYLLFITMLFYSFGYWWASVKTQYYVYDEKNIILSIYGNNVFVKTKEDFLAKKQNLLIIQLTSIDGKTLTYKTIQK